jgi:predicted dehydrogenase
MRVGVLGAAKITRRALIDPAGAIDGVEIGAVAARDPDRAAAFARDNGIAVVHPTYRALIEDDSLDAIYVPLPISFHAEWAIAALEAGRHVLCEKPFASNGAQAQAMVDTAKRCKRVLVEAFHWRYHPVASRMIELGGRIGPIRRIEASFKAEVDRGDIRFDLSLGGGSFMDLGCYCVHMVRTVLGTEPRVERAVAVEGPPGVDAAMEAELSFGTGGEALVASSMVETGSKWPEAMRFAAWGDRGTFEVLNPMAPQTGHRIRAVLKEGPVDETVPAGTSYEYQLRAFVKYVAGEEVPITGGADAVCNMGTIDAVYLASGLGVRR